MQQIIMKTNKGTLVNIKLSLRLVFLEVRSASGRWLRWCKVLNTAVRVFWLLCTKSLCSNRGDQNQSVLSSHLLSLTHLFISQVLLGTNTFILQPGTTGHYTLIYYINSQINPSWYLLLTWGKQDQSEYITYPVHRASDV